MTQQLWEKYWWFLTKVKILLLCDPATTFLGIYPKKLETYIHTKTYAGIFVTDLPMIARSWKQPTGPSVGT